MSSFGRLISTVFDRRYRGAVSKEAVGRSTAELTLDLLGTHGEVSGGALALLILDRYAAMDNDAKRAFFSYMTSGLEINPQKVSATLKSYHQTPSRKTYQVLVSACEPKRQELIRRLDQVPGATARMVATRRDLLEFLSDHPELEALVVDFHYHFCRGSIAGFWSCSQSVGTVPRRRWKRSSPMRQCTRSTVGRTCAVGSSPKTDAVSASFILQWRASL